MSTVYVFVPVYVPVYVFAPPQMMTFSLPFAFKICLLNQSVTPFLSGAPPPKKNPGSAPDLKGAFILQKNEQISFGV